MYTVNFSKKSWHYHLATATLFKLQAFEDIESTDICSYIRRVFLGSLLFFVFIVAMVTILAPVADAIAWVAAMIATGGYVTPDPVLQAGMVLSTTIIIVATCVFGVPKGIDMFREMRDNREPLSKKPDGFLKQCYRKFKDKTCFKVELV